MLPATCSMTSSILGTVLEGLIPNSNLIINSQICINSYITAMYIRLEVLYDTILGYVQFLQQRTYLGKIYNHHFM